MVIHRSENGISLHEQTNLIPPTAKRLGGATCFIVALLSWFSSQNTTYDERPN